MVATVVCHPSTSSKDFSSETTGGIQLNFICSLRALGEKVNIFGPGQMTKMATMPIYGKNLKKSSSPDSADCLET